MGKVYVKRKTGAPLQVATVVETQAEKIEDDVFVVEYCSCGNIITPRARKLQEQAPPRARKCFNCLLHNKQIDTVPRTKQGWAD